ncbi:MAG: hypothetical protein Q8R39_02195 [bacterium]|nr:hypothetical protein [bacterium]MDZ4285048.1 hypothetical protein [Patescibacteria group bacterium]
MKKYFPTLFFGAYWIFLGVLISQNVGWDMPDSSPGAFFIKPQVNFITNIVEDLLPGRGFVPGRFYPSMFGWLISAIFLTGAMAFVNIIAIVVLRSPKEYKPTIINAIYLLVGAFLPADITIYKILRAIPLHAGYGGQWGIQACGGFVCFPPPTTGAWAIIGAVAIGIVFALNHFSVSLINSGSTTLGKIIRRTLMFLPVWILLIAIFVTIFPQIHKQPLPPSINL